jgi:hypothetical protein
LPGTSSEPELFDGLCVRLAAIALFCGFGAAGCRFAGLAGAKAKGDARGHYEEDYFFHEMLFWLVEWD